MITGATTEVVPDIGLDRLHGLSVHYIKHVQLGKEDSVKSKERELEWRREERLRREEGLAETEAEAEGEWREIQEEMWEVVRAIRGMSIGLERLIRGGEGGGEGRGGDDGNNDEREENRRNSGGHRGGGEKGGGEGGRGNSGGRGGGGGGGTGRGSSAGAVNDRM